MTFCAMIVGWHGRLKGNVSLVVRLPPPPRDHKSGTILIDQHDQPHITDSGLAKRVEADTRQTQTGAVAATPSYMPPGQGHSE